MNNYSIKQYLLIGIIVFLAVAIAWQMFAFFPGLLGAITLYILFRESFFRVTEKRKIKKGIVATIYILASVIIIAIPLVGMIEVLIPKFNLIADNRDQLTNTINSLAEKLKAISPKLSINQEQVLNIVQNITSAIPGILNATANMLTNTVLAFFILYFMLVDGKSMEAAILKYLPLKDKNVDNIWAATRTLVVSNAIGIPVLAASQALVAILGYMIFGIEDYVLWGILTGICSLIPVVGCMLVWGPLCIYLYATGHTMPALGLAVYSFVITGGIDNVLRFTILKKIGDVHPVITALGIIVGVPLFGFMGFIFGPLLISYLLLLIKIYRVEFSAE